MCQESASICSRMQSSASDARLVRVRVRVRVRVGVRVRAAARRRESP